MPKQNVPPKTKNTSVSITQDGYALWSDLSKQLGIKRNDVLEIAIRLLATEKKLPLIDK